MHNIVVSPAVLLLTKFEWDQMLDAGMHDLAVAAAFHVHETTISDLPIGWLGQHLTG